MHASLEHGALTLSQVQSEVKVDDLRQQFTAGDATLIARFDAVAAALIRKTAQEARDGLALP